MSDLLKMYHDLVSLSIGESGVYPHHAIAIRKDAGVEMLVLDLSPKQVFLLISKKIKESDELIFALDRTCKDGQGTTLGDCVAGLHWIEGELKPFIIEYQDSPRIVKEIDWNNEFWTQALKNDIDLILSLS